MVYKIAAWQETIQPRRIEIMTTRYITPDTFYIMGEGGDQPNETKERILELACASDLRRLEVLQAILGAAIGNHPVMVVLADTTPIEQETVSTKERLILLEHSVTLARSLFNRVDVIVDLWKKGRISNRSCWIIEALKSVFRYHDTNSKIEIVPTTFPAEIAKSFHPDHHNALPDNLLDWIEEMGSIDDEAKEGFGLFTAIPSGYDLIRIDGNWQKEFQAREEKGVSRTPEQRNLEYFAHSLYECGLDIGAPDDELRTLLDPFVIPT